MFCAKDLKRGGLQAALQIASLSQPVNPVRLKNNPVGINITAANRIYDVIIGNQ